MTARRPMRFFRDIVVAAVKNQPGGVIRHHLYYGWNQYLWPLLIITDVNLGTAVSGYQRDDRYRRRYHAMDQVMAGNAAHPYPSGRNCVSHATGVVRGLVDSEK
ncbi:sn-Glycerol-3-phosphate transporter permease [Salmonella enterica subsp. enterica serovar Madelia]|nr:sn-Glycerol-3-phosphate transporter permease [Salmonella enterica subsp. enterica serovar Madelia]